MEFNINFPGFSIFDELLPPLLLFGVFYFEPGAVIKLKCYSVFLQVLTGRNSSKVSEPLLFYLRHFIGRL